MSEEFDVLLTRQILITVELPIGWDEEDFEYLTERLSYTLARDLPKVAYTVQEFEK